MNVVFNVLGERCTHGPKPQRWSHWRPTIAVCCQSDFVVDRLVLLHTEQQRKHLSTICADLKAVSPETEIQLIPLTSHSPGDLVETYEVLKSFAAGYPMQPTQQNYFVHTTPAGQIEQLCLLKLTESRYFPAKLLQTHAPEDGQSIGRFSIQSLNLGLSSEQTTALSTQNESLHTRLLPAGMTLRSHFAETLEQIASAALLTEEALFIAGPMGIGKSTLAKQLHSFLYAERKIRGPLLEVDCAAHLPDQITSRLFGAQGVLSTQQTGLLYIEGIESLQPVAQVNLLRALENGSITTVDTSETIELSTRILLGSRTNLSRAVKSGTFREDLWLRISAWQFDIPPIKERHADLEPAIDYALVEHMKRVGRRVHFAADARSTFLNFARTAEAKWPANFRDLQLSIFRLATFAQLGVIQPQSVHQEIRRLRNLWQDTTEAAPSRLLEKFVTPENRMNLDRFESVQLADVISVCLNSKTLSEAGRRLFSESRKKKRKANDADRLRKYLQKYDLDWNTFQA